MSLDQLNTNAENGQLSLHLDLDTYDNIIKACDAYLLELGSLKQDAVALSWHPLGFSEENLKQSGAPLATKFQQKADGADNSAANTFQSHHDRVAEMRGLFATLRSAYADSDRSNANRFGQR